MENKCLQLQPMKIIRANKGLKLSEASQAVVGQSSNSSGGGWRCLWTAQGIMRQKEKEASVHVGGGKVSESQLSINISR